MMSSDSFGISGPNAPTISEKIVASTLNAIQNCCPSDKIEEICARGRLHLARSGPFPGGHGPAHDPGGDLAGGVLQRRLAGAVGGRGQPSSGVGGPLPFARHGLEGTQATAPGRVGEALSRTSATRPRPGAKRSPSGEAIGWCCWMGRVSRCRRSRPWSRPSASIRAIMGKDDIRWPVWRRCVWRAR